jgi:fructokinase
VIRGSDEDFKLVFGIEDPVEIRDRFDLGSKLFLYTRNADGVHVIHDTEELEVPAESIEPLSTIGAGDNFNAGIVHFLLENGVRRMDRLTRKDLLNMAGTGVRFASHVCMQFDNYISRDFARSISRT